MVVLLCFVLFFVSDVVFVVVVVIVLVFVFVFVWT